MKCLKKSYATSLFVKIIAPTLVIVFMSLTFSAINTAGYLPIRSGVLTTNSPNESQLEAAIMIIALREGVPPKLMRQVCRSESNIKWYAYSRTARGKPIAFGLCQLKPGTFREMVGDLPAHLIFDPELSALAGTRYLKKQYIKFGNWHHALDAYYAGPGNVHKNWDLHDYPAKGYVKKTIVRWLTAEGNNN